MLKFKVPTKRERFGALAAERIAAGKLADAPHLVNGDAPFWRAVVRNMRAAVAQ